MFEFQQRWNENGEGGGQKESDISWIICTGVEDYAGTNYGGEMNVFTCKLPLYYRGERLIHECAEDKLCRVKAKSEVFGKP